MRVHDLPTPASIAVVDAREHMDAEVLVPRSVGWPAFAAARKRMDPDGLFRNAYLDRVLGVG